MVIAGGKNQTTANDLAVSSNSKSSNALQVAKQIKSVIETVYRDGVDRILKFDLDENKTIFGLFLDETQVYEFEITAKGAINYVESDDKLRSDSYLSGYLQIVKIRTDAPTKTRQCKVGKSCGNSCIAKGDRCQVKLAPLVAQSLPQLQQEISSLKLKGASTNKGTNAVASKAESPSTTTPDGQRNPVKSLKELEKVGSEADKLAGWKKAAVIGASIVGMSYVSYVAARTRYRAGFEESARMAREESNSVEVPNIPESKKAITFTVGGFYGSGNSKEEAYNAARKGEDYFEYKMNTEILGTKDNPGGDHFVVKHRNIDFNLEDIKTGNELYDGAQHVLLHYRQLIDTAVVKGRNPEAVKLAAEVMAYSEKYPDKEINLAGHSAGGMITHETAEILNKANIKVKIVNLGSGYFGFTEKVGESYTIASHEDKYLKTIPGTARDPVLIGDPSGESTIEKHMIRFYMNDPQSQSKIRELLAVKEKKRDFLDWDKIKIYNETENTFRLDSCLNYKCSGIVKDQFKKNYDKDLGLVNLLFTKTDEQSSNEKKLDLGSSVLPTLAKVISVAYRDGVDRILSVSVSQRNNTISGLFLDEKQIYKFEINDEGVISYIEADKELRTDAYLTSYFQSFVNDFSSRVDDNPVTKRRQCKVGKPCGNSCITKSDRCQIQLPTSYTKALPQIREAIKSSEDTQNNSQNPQQLKKPDSDSIVEGLSEFTKKAAIAGASLLGVSLVSYAAFRAKYRAGFGESVQMAKEQSEKFNVPELKSDMYFDGREMKLKSKSPEADQITFIVGGFGGEKGFNSIKWAREFQGKDDLFKNHHINSVDNSEFDIEIESTSLTGKREKSIEQESSEKGFKLILETALEKGRNPVAVKTAAQAYAYHQKYPDKPINLIGYSGGGMATHEAAELLQRMGVQVKVANFGSPYWGMTEKVGSSVTFASENDNVLDYVFVRDRINVSTVKDHFSYFSNPDVREKLSKFMNGEEISSTILSPEESAIARKKAERRRAAVERLKQKEGRKDSNCHYDENLKQEQFRQFLSMLKIIIERVYVDGIDQIFNTKINGDHIQGYFTDRNKIFKFTLSKSGLVYYPTDRENVRYDSKNDIKPNLYLDSKTAVEISFIYPGQFRVDRSALSRSRQKNCTSPTSYSCGSSCINNKKICRVGGQNVASKMEMRSLFNAAESVLDPIPSNAANQPTAESTINPGTEPETKRQAEKDPLDNLNIRDLKREASERGVYRYSVMTKEELKEAIKSIDSSPDQQNRVKRTIERRQKEREENPLKEWSRVAGLRKSWSGGSNPNAPLIAAAIILGLSIEGYRRSRDRYRGNFPESANIAKSRASGIQVDPVGNKQFITFAVDGYNWKNKEPGVTGQSVKTALEQSEESEFFKKHHIVAIGGEEFNILDDLPENLPSPIRAGIRGFQQMSRSIGTTLITGRNPVAVELAAQAYAYHKAYPNKPINFVGHSAGGMVTKEAAEILKFVDPEMARNLRVVNMGTPHFGMTEVVAKPGSKNKDNERQGRTVTIMSGGDLLNIFPKLNEVYVNTVKSHDLSDYLSDERSLQVLTETLGKYDEVNSTRGSYRAKAREPEILPVQRKDPRDPRNRATWGSNEESDKKALEDFLALKTREANRTKRQKAIDREFQKASQKIEKQMKAAPAIPVPAPKIKRKRSQSKISVAPDIATTEVSVSAPDGDTDISTTAPIPTTTTPTKKKRSRSKKKVTDSLTAYATSFASTLNR